MCLSPWGPSAVFPMEFSTCFQFIFLPYLLPRLLSRSSLKAPSWFIYTWIPHRNVRFQDPTHHRFLVPKPVCPLLFALWKPRAQIWVQPSTADMQSQCWAWSQGHLHSGKLISNAEWQIHVWEEQGDTCIHKSWGTSWNFVPHYRISELTSMWRSGGTVPAFKCYTSR